MGGKTSILLLACRKFVVTAVESVGFMAKIKWQAGEHIRLIQPRLIKVSVEVSGEREAITIFLGLEGINLWQTWSAKNVIFELS